MNNLYDDDPLYRVYTKGEINDMCSGWFWLGSAAGFLLALGIFYVALKIPL
jgi:hypothetical protein